MSRPDAGADSPSTAVTEVGSRERDEQARLLREAQRIARLGSWEWDVSTNRLRWSDTLCELYGIEPHEAPNDFDGYIELVHPDDRQLAREMAQRAFEQRDGFAFDHRVVHKDGTVRLLHGRGDIELDARGQVARMVGSSQDLTEQRRQQVELERAYGSARDARDAAERAVSRLARLQRLTEELARALTLHDLAEVVVVGVRESLGASSASLSLLVEGGSSLRMIRNAGVEERYAAEWRQYAIEDGMATTLAIRSRRPVFVQSAEEIAERFPRIAQAAADTQLNAYVVLPLLVGDTVLGTVSLGYSAPREFSDDERVYYTTVAQQCALALERVALFESEHVARRDAEDANLAKMRFLATMSHELRTPLNAIAGYAELLELGIRGPVTEAQLQDLGRIRQSQRHLLAIINDVLNFARVEAGHLELKIERFAVQSLLSQVQPLVEPQARARRQRLEVQAGEDMEAVADVDKTQQILLNLLSNAVKFTDEGGHIELSARHEGGMIAIEVTDSGVGIPAESLDRIFEPFVQLGGSLTSPPGGTGLGLAISRDLARSMKGDLRVQSTVGLGSTFTLLLPAA